MKEALQKLWANPYVQGFVRAAEAGVVVGFLEVTANGFKLSGRSLLAAIGGSAVMSIRNWLLASPLNPAVPAAPVPPEEKK